VLGSPSGWLRLPEPPSEGMQRLAGALIASLCVHALLLSWPVAPPSSGAQGFLPQGPSRPEARKLRVTLNYVPESPHAAPIDAVPPAPVPEEKSREVRREPGAEQSVPLIGYFPASRLSKMPQAVGVFDIQPPAGGDTGLGGKMTVRIWIGANGAIDRARVLSSGLPDAYAEAALTAFEKLRFVPGEIGGVPVKSWVEIVIEYADFHDEPQQPPGKR